MCIFAKSQNNMKKYIFYFILFFIIFLIGSCGIYEEQCPGVGSININTLYS